LIVVGPDGLAVPLFDIVSYVVCLLSFV
jgi:hypothetical protein